MVFLKLAAILFLVLTLLISTIFIRVFNLRKKGWNFADVAFPLFALEFYLISDKLYYHSLLPVLVLALSLLALGLALFFLFGLKEFSYARFRKIFWRSAFLVTFALYLVLVIALFTQA